MHLNVEILNSFDPELQPKDTESVIIKKTKKKLRKLLHEKKGFTFVATLVLKFKN